MGQVIEWTNPGAGIEHRTTQAPEIQRTKETQG